MYVNGRKVDLLENVIVEAGIQYGKKGAFYVIQGSGLCNSCSVYSAFYSMRGEELYKEYWSEIKSDCYQIGNFEEVMNRFGIARRKWNNRFTNIWVFPPVRSKQNIF